MKQARYSTAPRRLLGFTLIELMIVVAIVALLTLVAYPAYQNQVYQTRRSDAFVALSSLANDLEKYQSECSTYPTAGSTSPSNITGTRKCPGVGVPASGTLGWTSASSVNGYYTMSIVITSNPTTYTITATKAGVQTGDKNCKTLTLTNTGAKSATPDTGGDSTRCWKN